MHNRNGHARYGRWLTCLLFALLLWTGCAGSGPSFVHPTVDFSHIRRCALLPFQNLTEDGFADERLQSVFLMELLERGELSIVDPEETVGAMKELRLAPGSTLTPEQVVALGKALSVEAVFFGAVEEYGLLSRSRQQIYEITASFGMAEAETGNLIWRSQVHVDGSSFWKRIFGGESAGLYDISRKAVRRALGSLL